MIRNDCKRCRIFEEFSEEEQHQYFSLGGNKVVHNIDSYYYNVHLQNDSAEISNADIKRFIDDLRGYKEECLEEKVRELPFAGDLLFSPYHFSIYEYRITLENMFDIFIASYLPNDNTPRIQIQLRSIGLWVDGCNDMILNSYTTLVGILQGYGIGIEKCVENRIDYAYHTNIIQNTTKYFSDENLMNTLKTQFRKGQKVFDTRDFEVEYCALGMRKSNNLFFRAYNKLLEVIEKNYKGFFIGYWYENHLISEYDKWCMEFAYEGGTYNHLITARCEWYLQFGKNPELKEMIQARLKSCYEKSDNFEFLESSISGIIPKVTEIINVEYQTKRKFYHTMDSFIADLPSSVGQGHVLHRLFQVTENRKSFLDYLTSDTVSFISDGNYCSWWRRIRSVKVGGFNGKVTREYMRKLDRKKVAKRAVSAIASHSIYSNNINNDTFAEDISDFLSYFNDNDINDSDSYLFNGKTGEVIHANSADYSRMKVRKNRQLKSLLSKEDEDVKE